MADETIPTPPAEPPVEPTAEAPPSPPQAEAPPSPPPASLIYLDVDDEITSAASRIRGALTERVGLVLPYGSRLATSRINFRLLAREAAERGKQIELICADASARALAVAAGLPVHPSVAAFEGRGPVVASGGGGGSGGAGSAAAAAAAASAVAGTGAVVVPSGPEPDILEDTKPHVLAAPKKGAPKVPIVGPPRPPVRPRTALAFGVSLLALALVGGYAAVTFLPAATIVLHPRSEEIRPLEITIEARPDVLAPDAEALAIPAQRLTFQLATQATFQATGVKTVQTKATGNVTFSNFDTGGANQIDTGAIVRTQSGVEFKTLATVTLPNATIQFPFTIVPSTSSVGVEAVASGPDGNVGNNTITVVPKGENKNLLKVNNDEATSGGARTQSTVVSQEDVDAGMAAIAAALDVQLDQQVAAGTGVPVGITMFPETGLVGAPAYEADPVELVGKAMEEFELIATAEGTALGVDRAPIQAIAESRLEARVEPGWSLIPTTAVVSVGTPSVFGDIVSYPVTIGGTQVHDVDQPSLIASIRGLVLAEARSRLDDFGDVEITLWPDWVTAVPTRPDRITFELAAPQPSATPSS